MSGAAALAEVAASVTTTPVRVFLDDVAEARCAEIAHRLALGSRAVRLRFGCSIKTNPHPELLAAARRHGAYAEAISHGELALATGVGFTPNEMIYNGPSRIDRALAPRVAVAFADSLEALKRYLHADVADIVGVRLRPRGIVSRFGIPIDQTDAICALLRPARREQLAFSFHVRPQDYGGARWSELFAELVEAAARAQDVCGASVTLLDGGGGWTPERLDALVAHELPGAATAAAQRLERLREVVIEPGQGIATPVEALVTSVIEVRRNGQGRDVVVDANRSHLPKIDAYPHRIFAFEGGALTELAQGADRLLGSACLEDDILAQSLRLPPRIAEGDLLVIGDCGSYDASMHFPFAAGERAV